MSPQTAELPLRDIHPAMTPPWWPPAPGWWLVALAAGLLAVWLAWRGWRRWQRLRRRRALRAELMGIVAHWHARRDDARFLAAISTYFRRLIVHVGGYRDMAGVSGAPWARFVGRPAADREQRELADALAEDPYRPVEGIGDATRFVPLAERWIKLVTERRHG